MVCHSPLLAAERARKRQELLEATERVLDPMVTATTRAKRRLRGTDAIAMGVGKVIDKLQYGQAFRSRHQRRSVQLPAQRAGDRGRAALDGLYIVRTSLADDELNAEATVRAYKEDHVPLIERAAPTNDSNVGFVLRRPVRRV